VCGGGDFVARNTLHVTRHTSHVTRHSQVASPFAALPLTKDNVKAVKTAFILKNSEQVWRQNLALQPDFGVKFDQAKRARFSLPSTDEIRRAVGVLKVCVTCDVCRLTCDVCVTCDVQRATRNAHHSPPPLLPPPTLPPPQGEVLSSERLPKRADTWDDKKAVGIVFN